MEVLKVEEFKTQNGINEPRDIYRTFQGLGIYPVYFNCIDAQKIFKFMQGDRNIVVSENGERKTIYISTLADDNDKKACCISFAPGFYECAEIDYDRITNGVNQQGLARVEHYNAAKNEIGFTEASYAVRLRLAEDGAAIYYYPSLAKSITPIEIKVNATSLDAANPDEYKVSETLKNNHALDWFKMSRLRGSNTYLTGKKVYSLKEDLNVFEGTGYRR